MNFDTALSMIANAFNFDPKQLAKFGIATDIGGYHSDKAQEKWPVGCIWGVEGDVLYALTRILQPEVVVEIGTFHGCSATHIAMALKHNEKGRLICVDNWNDGVQPGDLIPTDLLSLIEFVNQDGATYVEGDMPDNVGMVFEDGNHSTEQVQRVWSAAAEKLLPGGVIVGHDAAHFLVGEAIKRGILQSGLQNFRVYPIAPSDCGLAIWRKPGLFVDVDGATVNLETLEKPKPKTPATRRSTKK